MRTLFRRARAGQERKRPQTNSKVPLTYYRSSNQNYRSEPRAPKRISAKAIIRRLTRLSSLVLIFGLLIFNQFINTTAEISLDSKTYRSHDTYLKAVNQEVAKFKNHFRLSFDEASLERNLQNKFPELAQVKVDLPIYKRTPKVELTISKPSFMLAGAAGTYGEQNKFIVASNGKAVGLAADFLHITNLPVITDQSSLPVAPGVVVLGHDMSRFILAILAQCQASGIPVAAFNLPQGSQDIELRTSDQPYLVKFHQGGDPRVQTGQFIAARQQFNKDGTQPSQYLDVRVEGRIYYK